MNLYTRKLAFDAAADSALLAQYTTDSVRRGHHITEMRENIAFALSGCRAGEGQTAANRQLISGIHRAITDTLNWGGNDLDAAHAVVNHLLDTIAPMPVDERQEDAA